MSGVQPGSSSSEAKVAAASTSGSVPDSNDVTLERSPSVADPTWTMQARPRDETLAGDARPGDPSAELLSFLAPAQAADELGRLGDYRIQKILGQGGMGVVFLAEDPKLRRQVAIKAMLPHLAQSGVSHQRFLREAQAAAAVEHDHIVPILHVGECRGAPYIVMPFLRGESLDSLLRRDEAIPLALVLQIGIQAADALVTAHQRGLIHRDLKPANLWLEQLAPPSLPGESTTVPAGRGPVRVKLLDFGLACLLHANEQEHLTQTGAILGTPGYMPPEQAEGQELDGRADLFSLGCVLYLLATRRASISRQHHDGASAGRGEGSARPAGARESGDSDGGLSELIMQLLAKNREERPASGPGRVGAFASHCSRADRAAAAAPARQPDDDLVDRSRPDSRLEPAQASGGADWGRLAVPRDHCRGRWIAFRGKGSTDGDKRFVADASWPPEFTNSIGMEFILVHKGSFFMGGGGGKVGDKEVEIRNDFYLGVFEVTQGEWQAIMNSNPSEFSRNGEEEGGCREGLRRGAEAVSRGERVME